MMKTAIELIAKGKFKQAEEVLRPLVEKDPANTEALFHLALARRDQDDVWEAIDLLQQAIKTQPRNATLYFALGNMQLGIPDYDEAEMNFLKSAGLDPNNVDARNGIAFLEIRQSRFKAAEHSLMIALNIDPDNVQALVFIGIAMLEQSQHERAIEYLQKAVKLGPDNTQAQFCLGRALLAAGNAGFAVQCFENASKAEPQTAEFKDWLACAQLNSGQITEAKENFQAAIQMGRMNVEILTGLVKIETLQGNMEAALGTMLQAVELKPDQKDLALRYADMLMENRHFDEASNRLEGLLAAGFEPQLVRVRLATALIQKGDAEQALATLEPLKNEADSDTEAMTPETRLMLTWALQECGDGQGASEQLHILLAMDKPLFDAVLFRARQMYDAGDDQAVELLRQVLKRDDIDSAHVRQAQILLAAALDQAGDYKAAVVTYRGLAGRTAAVTQIAARFYRDGSKGGSTGERAASIMDPEATASWPVQPPDDNRGQPVFVFAWPGSGRAHLLDSLGQHPGLIFLPDEPGQQNSRLGRLMGRQGLKALEDLDEAGTRLSRRNYWKTTGLDRQLPAGQPVIDPLWLTAEVLPAVARYFPGATVLVLTREPRDMAIAWMQTGYLELEKLASQYQSQLDMLQQYRTSLPLNFVEIDYDELCDDAGSGLNSILQSLGLEPEAAAKDYFDNATARLPAKPGDWKHYQHELKAVFDRFTE